MYTRPSTIDFYNSIDSFNSIICSIILLLIPRFPVIFIKFVTYVICYMFILLLSVIPTFIQFLTFVDSPYLIKSSAPSEHQLRKLQRES